ncbi:hypothetical protein [Bacillus amyloliquefaciens]|nr:hypothetical protein [Bacillus amyloliquefaciens]MEC3840868.1 hypothetical protein [Bacillus amyloliquefaciens]
MSAKRYGKSLKGRKKTSKPGGVYSPLHYVTGAGWQLVCFIIK